MYLLLGIATGPYYVMSVLRGGGKWENQNPPKRLCGVASSTDILTKSSFFPYTYPHFSTIFMCITSPDTMTDKDIHIIPHTEETTKQPVDNYGLLFPIFFTPTVEDRDGGKLITWDLLNGPKSITGWVHLETPKKKWLRKPIISGGHYTITCSNLDKIHEFMGEFIQYDEDSPTKIREFFVKESLRVIQDGGN